MFVRGWYGQKGSSTQADFGGTQGEAELFQLLPREMWLLIFDFLSAKDACQAKLVCKTWRFVVFSARLCTIGPKVSLTLLQGILLRTIWDGNGGLL